MTFPLDPTPEKFVTVARILRPRGNRGEVAAELLTDFPERLKERKEVWLCADSGAPSKVGLEAIWMDRNHRGQCVFHFAGVSSIDDAEKLRGLNVQIPMEQRQTLPSGSYFASDLIGCSIFELSNAAPTLLGRVRDVYFPGEGQPGTPLLALDTSQGELLIPLAQDICRKIDLYGRRIEVVLPEGLSDLND